MDQPYIVRTASAMVRNGYMLAAMVAGLLSRLSNVRKSYPEPFLLELGAICQLKLWEDAGLLPHLSMQLPSYSAAMGNMINRLRTSRNPYPAGTENIAVVDLVNRAKIEVYFTLHLALESTHYHSTIDLTDEQLSKIADFLWEVKDLATKKKAAPIGKKKTRSK